MCRFTEPATRGLFGEELFLWGHPNPALAGRSSKACDRRPALQVVWPRSSLIPLRFISGFSSSFSILCRYSCRWNPFAALRASCGDIRSNCKSYNGGGVFLRADPTWAWKGRGMKATSENQTSRGGPGAGGRIDNQKSKFDTQRRRAQCTACSSRLLNRSWKFTI